MPPRAFGAPSELGCAAGAAAAHDLDALDDLLYGGYGAIQGKEPVARQPC